MSDEELLAYLDFSASHWSAERRELHEKLQNVEYSWMIKVKERDDAYEENARLIAERDEAQRHVEELQEKLNPEHSCACSYDHAGTICGFHSPMLEKAEAEIARLRGLLRRSRNQFEVLVDHGDWHEEPEGLVAIIDAALATEDTP